MIRRSVIAVDSCRRLFRSSGLNEPSIRAIQKGLGFQEPLGLQSRAIQHILDGKSVILGDRTGQGKTLAYLMPVLDKMHAQNSVSTLHGLRPGAPKALILTPSNELARQVFDVCRTLKDTRELEFRPVLLSGGVKRQNQIRDLEAGVDIVVGTPNRVNELLKENKLRLSDCSYVVVDEADTMVYSPYLDESKTFKGLIDSLLAKTAPKRQVVVVSATFERKAVHSIQKTFVPFCPNIQPLLSDSMHMLNRKLRMEFLPLGNADKQAMAIDIVKDALRQNTDQTIVFCNTIKSCRSLSFALDEAQLEHLALHSQFLPRKRKEILDGFREKATSLLVATDVACRGLDFPDVGHIVLFDFPKNATDFLHRIGRTARANQAGHVTALVSKSSQALAYKLEALYTRGKPLDQFMQGEIVASARKDSIGSNQASSKTQAAAVPNRTTRPNEKAVSQHKEMKGVKKRRLRRKIQHEDTSSKPFRRLRSDSARVSRRRKC